MMKLFGWFNAAVSKNVLRIIVGLTVVLYVAFFLFGFNHPYDEDPDFIEPRLTSALIFFVFLIVLIALAVTVWAIGSSMRKRGSQVKAADGLPTSRIAAIVVALMAVMMVASFWMGSTESMSVNGKSYADTLGLRTADMFVFTSLTMMVMAAAVAALSSIRSHFRRRR